MHEKKFTTSLSIDEIKSRLSSLDNFKVKDSSADELNATVGSVFKFKMLGVYITDDYQAPIAIEANSESAEGASEGTTVTLSSNSPDLFTTPKANRFFERDYTHIQQLLEA